MHKSKELQINNESIFLKSLTQSNFRELQNIAWTFEERAEFLIFSFTENLFVKNNNYSFRIDFKKFFKDEDANVGLYRSFYIDNNGTKRFIFFIKYRFSKCKRFLFYILQLRWLIGSSMEPIYARKAFICFDEMEMKSAFKIIVVHSCSLNVFSNMPIKSSNHL